MPAYTSQQLTEISKHTIRLLDEWGLNGQQVIEILALPKKIKPRHLDRFRDGEAFPHDEIIMSRIEHITGIADALRTSFPRNAHMGVIWMRTPHKRFHNQTPLQLLIKQGLSGLLQVRAELDCAFAWDESQSNKNL